MVNKRRDIIREYIGKTGEIKVRELEEMFPDVSNMTLRRDLAFLENEGCIIRTLGGAKSIHSFPAVSEDIYSLRAAVNLEGKDIIAKKAVEFIEPGRSIFIDSGTTMMCLARILPDENLSILTSGPNVSLEIIKKSQPTVTLIGGQLSRNTLSTSGANSMEFIRNVNIDTAFLATSG
jgi:DeoR/GlpR family transcriptional regulator of sugar metabolism